MPILLVSSSRSEAFSGLRALLKTNKHEGQWLRDQQCHRQASIITNLRSDQDSLYAFKNCHSKVVQLKSPRSSENSHSKLNVSIAAQYCHLCL